MELQIDPKNLQETLTKSEYWSLLQLSTEEGLGELSAAPQVNTQWLSISILNLLIDIWAQEGFANFKVRLCIVQMIIIQRKKSFAFKHNTNIHYLLIIYYMKAAPSGYVFPIPYLI